MSKIGIRVDQNYKSFPGGFHTEIEGDLIILSGINGSGKSQLLDLIRQNRINNTPLPGEIAFNGVVLHGKEVLYRSFKENIGIPELTEGRPQNITNNKNNIWSYYNNYRLDTNRTELNSYKLSAEEAKEILIKEYGERFNVGLTQQDINKAIPDDFIWKTDDVFTNFIGDLFYIHALKIYKGQAEIGKVGGSAFDKSTLGEAPRKELNKLFEKLGFSYRFKDDYEIALVELNEQPKIYPIQLDGRIDENITRGLNELSDGEKAIISLAFASLNGAKDNHVKILLLDEFDATFNPSLTEIFFNILKDYFLDKGITVVMATHSPTTISLAPEYATFYEVFKPNTSTKRILRVNRDDYQELQIANKTFYEKIKNQESRIEELEAKNHVLNSLIESTGDTPLIITEGKTDWKHILGALKLYFHTRSEFQNITENNFLQYEHGEYGDNLINDLKILATRPKRNIILGITDRDKGQQDYETYGNNVFKIRIPLPSFRQNSQDPLKERISIEHYYTDNEIKTEIEIEGKQKRLFMSEEFSNTGITSNQLFVYNKTDRKKALEKCKIIDDEVSELLDTTKKVCLSKNQFADYVLSGTINISSVSRENFRPLLEKINEILFPTPSE